MDQILLLGIIVLTFIAFAFEWLPIDAVAFTCLGLLLVTDLVSPEEAISGFSNPAVLTVMMMFILSHGLTKTGLISIFAHKIAQISGRTQKRGSYLLLLTSGTLSAFINNTAAMAILMPVAMQLAKRFRFSPSKILLPLSYISIIGGTCTLIGTSTNLLVGSISESFGLEPFSMFEFATLGALLFVVGMIYIVVVPMRLLPSRSIISSLTRKYHLSAYLTELRITAGSRLIGRTVLGEQISDRFELNVLEIVRGERRISIDIRNTQMMPDDVLIVRGGMEEILAFKENYNLLLLTDIKLGDEDLSDQNNILVELQVSPFSRLAGQSLKQVDFRRAFGCFVLALNRTGETIRDRLASIPLKQWDTLLVFGPRARVEALYLTDDFVPLQELDLKISLPRRWWLNVAIVPLVVVLATTGLMTILEASILGSVVLIISGSLTIQQAYQSVNWTVIFLLACILPIGIAMENTGLSVRVGDMIAHSAGAWGPIAVLALIYLVTALLSEIVSNNTTAVLMVPISITVALDLGIDPRPLVMAVAFAASSSFMTPMGYQTNAMVYGPGGYRFIDYLRAGGPLKLIFWIVSTLLIPVLWPI